LIKCGARRPVKGIPLAPFTLLTLRYAGASIAMNPNKCVEASDDEKEFSTEDEATASAAHI
jgi:hypothetical protein